MVSHVIFKYQMPLVTRYRLPMPHHARILHVGVQRGKVTLWAQHHSPEFRITAPPVLDIETREFRLIGTGDPFNPAGLDYVGTVRFAENSERELVLHIYEEGRRATVHPSHSAQGVESYGQKRIASEQHGSVEGRDA